MTAAAQARGALIELYLGEGRRDLRRGAHALGRRLRRGGLRAVFFHRVDSPDSYLFAQALSQLVPRYGLELDLVVVPEPAVDFDPEPELRARHALRDAAALAPSFGLAFPPASALPASSASSARPASTALPLAARVRMANAVLLVERPAEAQLALAVALGRALFSGDGAALHALADEHGAVAGQDVSVHLEANYQRLCHEGHYVDASLHCEGEWYVGVDRLSHLEARLGGGEAPVLRRSERAPVRFARPLELFFSFRSPYSYLALARLEPMVAAGLALELRPVAPMVTRGLPVPRRKIFYIIEDASREARRHGVPFGRLSDPIGPAIDRCLAVAKLAEERGLAYRFALEAGRAIWSEAADLTRDDELFVVTGRAGLAEAEVRAALGLGEAAAWLDRAREELTELGLWGVPSFRVGDRCFFGQDRLTLALEAAGEP